MAEDDGKAIVIEAMGIDWWRSIRLLGFLISSQPPSVPAPSLSHSLRFTSITPHHHLLSVHHAQPSGSQSSSTLYPGLCGQCLDVICGSVFRTLDPVSLVGFSLASFYLFHSHTPLMPLFLLFHLSVSLPRSLDVLCCICNPPIVPLAVDF